MLVNLRGCEGRAPVPGFPGNWWANLMSISPVNGSLLPLVEKIVDTSCLPSSVNGGVSL